MKSGRGITSRLSVEYDGIFPYSVIKLVNKMTLTFTVIFLSLLFIGEFANLDTLNCFVDGNTLHVDRSAADVTPNMRWWAH
jgi:hypothetical protein